MTAPSNDIQRMLGEIQRSVGRIEGQTSVFIDQMKVQDERTGKIETRVRAVESRQHWYSGAGAMLGMFLGAIGIHLKTP